MREYKWMRDLSPAEAQAALAALDKQPPPSTVNEILGLRAMREALQAKIQPPKRRTGQHSR
jgi:hypothetical protein